jgi:hypothetical protein
MINIMAGGRVGSRFPDRESTDGLRDATLRGMVALTRSIVVQAPADAVWRVVAGGFDRIGEWATAIPASIPASTANPITALASEPVTDAPVPGRVCRTGVALVPEVTDDRRVRRRRPDSDLRGERRDAVVCHPRAQPVAGYRRG